MRDSYRVSSRLPAGDKRGAAVLLVAKIWNSPHSSLTASRYDLRIRTPHHQLAATDSASQHYPTIPCHCVNCKHMLCKIDTHGRMLVHHFPARLDRRLQHLDLGTTMPCRGGEVPYIPEPFNILMRAWRERCVAGCVLSRAARVPFDPRMKTTCSPRRIWPQTARRPAGHPSSNGAE